MIRSSSELAAKKALQGTSEASNSALTRGCESEIFGGIGDYIICPYTICDVVLGVYYHRCIMRCYVMHAVISHHDLI